MVSRDVIPLLVVEDEPDYRDTLSLAFKAAGYSVAAVESGEQAVTFLKNHSEIKGVILDYTLPDMNGIEVFKKVRAISKDVFVFLHTAYTERAVPEIGEAIHSMGPAVLVEKVSVSGKAFCALVDSVLRQGH